jgi:MtN3 and saliva related transmembrane protein
MEITFIIGSIAACATTISFLPQAKKVITTRDTRSISLWMYLLFSIGVALWLVYGILKRDPPIIVANGVTFLLAVIIFFYKLTEKKQ